MYNRIKFDLIGQEIGVVRMGQEWMETDSTPDYMIKVSYLVS